MDVRGSGDHEIDRAPPRLSPAADNGSCKTSPFARDRRVDGQGIECGLDHTEPLRSTGSLVFRVGNEDAEVQLGE